MLRVYLRYAGQFMTLEASGEDWINSTPSVEGGTAASRQELARFLSESHDRRGVLLSTGYSMRDAVEALQGSGMPYTILEGAGTLNWDDDEIPENAVH